MLCVDHFNYASIYCVSIISTVQVNVMCLLSFFCCLEKAYGCDVSCVTIEHSTGYIVAIVYNCNEIPFCGFYRCVKVGDRSQTGLNPKGFVLSY